MSDISDSPLFPKAPKVQLVPGREKPEMVNHPNHYGSDNVYETIKVLEAWGLNENARLWNAVKYISRAGKKDSSKYLEDLKKASFYLSREIEKLEQGND